MTISFTLSASPTVVPATNRTESTQLKISSTVSQKVQPDVVPETRPAEEARPASEVRDDPARRSGDLQDLVVRANQRLLASSAVIAFDVDPDTKQVVTTLLDSRTNEVIRQIPSEAVLEIARSLDKITSVLVDQKL